VESVGGSPDNFAVYNRRQKDGDDAPGWCSACPQKRTDGSAKHLLDSIRNAGIDGHAAGNAPVDAAMDDSVDESGAVGA
jgi:hypothetical protein